MNDLPEWLTTLEPSDLRPRPWSRRSVVDRAATGWMVASLLLVMIPLGAVLASLGARGLPPVASDFPRFFTAEVPIVVATTGPGVGPAIVGTLVITAVAAAMAIPLGILGAVYLHEIGPRGSFAQAVRLLARVTTSVPSVVMGLFVYLVWTTTFGLQGFGGSLALACLMLPVVLLSTEEMLRLVPDALREASYALGATRTRTILAVVLPTAAPGIASGCLLAVARAAGETAPLVFTIGAATGYSSRLLHQAATALPVQIFVNALEPYPGAQQRAWGAAVTLVLLSFASTVASRVLLARAAAHR